MCTFVESALKFVELQKKKKKKKKKIRAFDYILIGVTKYSLIVSSASFEIYSSLELTSVI